MFDGDPAPPEKGHSPPPNFWQMSIVAKWLEPAWKRRGPIVVLALHKFVTYSFRHPFTYSPRTHMGHLNLKPTHNFKNCSCVFIVYNCHTIQHRTVSPIMSTGGKINISNTHYRRTFDAVLVKY